jgi:hypothetical protein
VTNATTGSERVVPGQRQPARGQATLLTRLIQPVRTHWQFSVVLLAALVARIVVVLGYPPVFWFSDSYNYVYDAVTHIPDAVRPNGYPFLLDLLLPLHSDYAISLLQAAMGLGVGVAIYALLRHRGLPWWGASLPTLPVLFDSYELHLEHLIAADTLFMFLVTVAVVMLCWSDRPSVLAMGVAGLLIGYATLVRSVGEPLLAVVFVAMLVRWVGWRRLAALAIAGIVPIAAYMVWFHGSYGKYALSESSGAFLYSRVSTFAECSSMKLPASLEFLCDSTKPEYRPVAAEYIWADYELQPYQNTRTPVYTKLGSDTAKRFTPGINHDMRDFAVHAIEAQPVAYASAVANDILHTFGWFRQPDPNNYYGNGPNFSFVTGAVMNANVPWYATPVRLPGAPSNYCNGICLQKDNQARIMQSAERDFAGGQGLEGLGLTQAVRPWARLLEIYQKVIYLRGTLFGIILLIGAAGLLARWRRWGGIALLPWLVGALLILLPPMTTGFSYRYVLAAVPVTCLAAGLVFARSSGQKSVRALAADLRRHFGRGGAVDQE